MLKYKFSNKTMFAIVMRDEAVCKEFIERLFPERKVREIHFAEPEPELTAEGQLISNSLGKLLSINSLKAGMSYRELKKSYVIFICMYDPFEMGEALYEFEMTDKKLDLQLNDGTYTIVVNIKCPKGKIPSELEPFYTYVDTGKVDENDLLTRMIDERVELVNSDKEVSGAMTLEEEIKIQREYGLEEGLERGEKIGLERGRNEGAAQKQREIAKNLKIIGVPTDKIAEATGLSPNEVENL